MKNAMSGGKGKVSRYTQKFKQSYNRFVKIGDNDDEKDEEIVKLFYKILLDFSKL